jgi:hypothetical protein
LSSGLQLRLSKYLLGADVPNNGVVANIYALDPDRHANSRRNVVIPVGHGGKFQRVELEPGHYLVEAMMPSGDIVSQEADAVEGLWQEVKLKAEPSAHEWHSWQNLLGNVQSFSGYYAADKPDLPNYEVLLSRDRWPPPHNYTWDVLADIIDYGELGLFHRPYWGWLQPQIPTHSDAVTQLHSFRMNYPASRTELPRWYAVVLAPQTARLLTVPSPWYVFDEEVPSELLITKSVDEPIGTSWVVRDPKCCTMLGYLAQGAFQAALRVANYQDALDMLFEKFSNPLGAAAGGYLLLGAMRPDEEGDRPRWHDWIRNLMNYFEWLPDGAIQYAWLKLRQGELERNRQEARAALFEAYNRGLPYYSLGLRWLVDGLTLLGEDDDEAKQRLRMVQEVAWHADMSNLFTALTMRR